MATLCGVLVLYSCYLLQRIRAGISFLKVSSFFFFIIPLCSWLPLTFEWWAQHARSFHFFFFFVFSFVCVWLWDHSGERLCRPLLTYAVEWLSRKHVCFSLRQTVLSSPSAPNYCWRHICWFFWLLSFFSYSFRFLCVCVVVRGSFFCSVFFIQEKKNWLSSLSLNHNGSQKQNLKRNYRRVLRKTIETCCFICIKRRSCVSRRVDYVGQQTGPYNNINIMFFYVENITKLWRRMFDCFLFGPSTLCFLAGSQNLRPSRLRFPLVYEI